MRGEHLGKAHQSHLYLGSSPHARGALDRRVALHIVQGIIPACAGSTHRPKSNQAVNRDHPRMRGEHSSQTTKEREASGSSPHARGAPHYV